jgi:hypothetical protein
MATGMYSWSQTAASNSTADSAINWAEGQLPSTVNDSGRGMMSILAKWRDDISGVQPSNVVQTSAGAANVQTLTTNGSIAALTNGWTLTFKAGYTNSAACTLNVDSLGAKSIQRISGTALAGGELIAGCVYTVTYHQPADAWILHSSGTVSTLSANLSAASYSLGTSTSQAADLFLEEGGVINWDNGDATITQTANDITIAGITTFGVGTSTAVTLGTIELGAASDTTIARSSAGVATIEGAEIITGNPVSVAKGGTGQTTAAEAIGELTQALTADTAPDYSADYVSTYDASADTGKKVLLSTLANNADNAAKAWGFINGGGTPAIAASYNVTSVTDSGQGLLTVTLTTPFSSANYCVVATVHSQSSGIQNLGIKVSITDASNFTLRVEDPDGNENDPSVGYSFVCYGAQ